MTLSEFRASEGLNLSALASRLALPISTVHGYLDNRRKPSLDIAARIVEATDGKVTLADLRPDLAAAFAHVATEARI